MSNLSKVKQIKNKIFYTVVPDGLRQKVFHVFPDGTFEEQDIIYIRVDNVLETPLRILVNDREWSITINEELGVLCADQFSVEEFLDELYFVMEEIHGLDAEHRTTKPDKIVTDLKAVLGFKIKGEENGEEEKFTDREDQ
jgi:hypothetical protein